MGFPARVRADIVFEDPSPVLRLGAQLLEFVIEDPSVPFEDPSPVLRLSDPGSSTIARLLDLSEPFRQRAARLRRSEPIARGLRGGIDHGETVISLAGFFAPATAFGARPRGIAEPSLVLERIRPWYSA